MYNPHSIETPHERLFNHGRIQRDKIARIQMEAQEEVNERLNISRGRSRSEQEANDSTNRLYFKSIKQQHEGKQRRLSIQKKLAPRAPIPTKKIRAEDANKIYERGMIHKLKLEIMREEASMTKDYVSPLLDPLIEDKSKPMIKTLSNKTTSASRVRPRSRLRTQRLSVTPGSLPPEIRTPSHTKSRSQTPQRFPSTSHYIRSSTPIARSSTPIARSITPTTRGIRLSRQEKGIPNIRARSLTPLRNRPNQ